MTDPDVTPPVDPASEASQQQAPPLPPSEPVSAAPSGPASIEAGSSPARLRLLPWLFGIGFLLMAAAIGYLWWLTQQPSPSLVALQRRVASMETPPAAAPPPTADLQSLAARVAALEQRQPPDIAALRDQVTALQRRPAPDLAPLQAQLNAQQHDEAAALGTLEARVASLERRPAADLTPLSARVAELEKRPTDGSQLAARLDTLAAQIQALSDRDRAGDADTAHRLDAAETRLTALEHAIAHATETAQRAARLARIDAAQAALAAGQPLGDVPGAPPAVTRFATVGPPTEAALRLAFTKAAEAALAAASPDADNKPFMQQVLARAEGLITVRRGDQVLLGNPVSGVLARAHTALDAGDLSGAVAAVASLSGPPAAAMAAWLTDARALLAARAGLVDMAAHA